MALSFLKNSTKTMKGRDKLIYIGIDQSSRVVGYAIMDKKTLVDYGAYNVPNAKNIELMERASMIIDFIDSLIKQYNEEHEVIVGLEDTQESRMNTSTFQLLTKLLGAIEWHLYAAGVTYEVCHVSSWRKHAGVKGKRREDKKKHAIDIVRNKFNIEAEEDAAEAVLIADYLREKNS